LQQPNTQQPSIQQPKVKRAVVGFALSLVGGILILLRGIVRIILGHDILNFAYSDEVRHRLFAGIAFTLLGVVAIVFAVIIMVGAYLMYTGVTQVGGTIVIIFSVLSIFVGSGWLIGLILGLIGGILGLLKT
jgi:hypothetical protein